ncbi:MAG: cystathionine gamma-synthase [Acidimicrobiia bacterium]|nr:cystathionine gamma-synthase [Acidimicrobiia bacterium]NNC76267.1 cystathionine gamma-synthase [Acidimicrobiia bacterium]
MAHFETDAIHAGQEPEPTTGSAVVPIYATSTYVQSAPGEHTGYEYSRTDNPTRTALQTMLAALEGAGDDGGCVATASGMAATALIGYLLQPGDHVVLPNDAYGGTHRFFARVLGEQGIEHTVADLTDVAALEEALRPETKLVWIETPTNPLLRVVDLAAVIPVARSGGALVCVDNTFATPYLTRPLEFGADMVLHSTTKYLGGHSDVIGGAIVTGDAELLERLRFLQNAVGSVPGPFDAYLVLRGAKTLSVRMDRHCHNAREVAAFLAGDDRVAEVFYPGLPSHPQHDVAARQMRDYGGMISFRPTGGVESARKTSSATEYWFLAESLGGVESLIEVPSLMTHMSVVGTSLEVPADLIRLSVGIEHIDDLIADLDQALGSGV